MGPGHAAQHVKDRQTHGEQDAVEDARGEHPDDRGQCEHQLAAPKARDAPELLDVDQAQGGVDDDGAQRRGGEAREQRPEEQQGGQDERQRDK